MPKVKAICRDMNNYERKNNSEIQKVFRNNNPDLHPHAKSKEYVRALNAAKLERIFAKPFLFSLSEHTDGIKTMSKNPKSLTEILSGSFDGQIILWDVPRKKPIFNIATSHEFVKGVCFNNNGEEFISCGDDLKVNIWSKSAMGKIKQKYENNLIDEDYLNENNNNFTNSNYMNQNSTIQTINYRPKNIISIDGNIESIDHSHITNCFAVAGSIISVYDYERNFPVVKYSNSIDGFIKVKYNYVEENILLSTGFDRSINLYDSRINTPTHNLTMPNKSSAAAWNPQEPFTFTIGNEDSHCYTYDMRRLDKVKQIHKDHLLAVLDIDYSPTGKEFVTGSFDKTVRIFNAKEGHSREVYHNKRMQKVFSVLYSQDDRYIISGSDDTNIRYWKSVANQPNKMLSVREKESLGYRKKLIEQYKYNPEVKRIIKKKNLPKYIVNRKNVRHIQKESKFRKRKNIEMNSKLENLTFGSEKLDKVVKSGVIEEK